MWTIRRLGRKVSGRAVLAIREPTDRQMERYGEYALNLSAIALAAAVARFALTSEWTIVATMEAALLVFLSMLLFVVGAVASR